MLDYSGKTKTQFCHIINRSTALSRFHSLEKRLAKNPTIARKCKDTINDYIEKGHATKLKDERSNKISNIANYISHHYILEPNKPGKIRVVFDAAAKHNNISLNEKLLKGPDLLNSLSLKFRKGEYAVMVDIEKIFHQVYVLEKDRDALRFYGEINHQAKYMTILRTFTCLVKSTRPAVRVGH